MKTLKRLLGVFVILGAALIAGAYLLPREVTVTRSTVIAAPPDAIFPHVNALQATQRWSPWLERDPDVQVIFSGPDSGVGNAMSWTSAEPNVGNGTQRIVESAPNERVVTALDFGAMGTAEAAFLLAPSGAGTQVTWTLVSDLGNGPMGRYLGLMMDRWVGGDYETGLANLKALVEGGA